MNCSKTEAMAISNVSWVTLNRDIVLKPHRTGKPEMNIETESSNSKTKWSYVKLKGITFFSLAARALKLS